MTRNPRPPWAALAAILEASCRKPGNVHPGRAFADTTYTDFVLSAVAVEPALVAARRRPLGATILEAVEATRRVVGKNTNLGIVLLLAPLASLPPRTLGEAGSRAGRRRLRRTLERRLRRTTRRDAELAYGAIRIARPGGLGSTARGDVQDGPTGTLQEMMRLARHRDLVARQYANGFRDVLDIGIPALQATLAGGASLETAVILCHLRLLARLGDSLIARKCGAATAAAAARRARGVLAAGWPERRGSAARLRAFDRWLRADGNRRNPGACADLTAAALFLALTSGIIRFPLEVALHGQL